MIDVRGRFWVTVAKQRHGAESERRFSTENDRSFGLKSELISIR